MVGGAGRFLTFSKVNGRSLGEPVVFIKACFYQKKKTQEKTEKTMWDTVKQLKMSSTQTEIIRYGLF